MTRRLARACAAHPWRTMAVWLVAIVLGVAGAAAGLGSLTTEGAVTNHPDSIRAKNLIEQRLPALRTPTELVVVRSERLTVDQPGFRTELARRAATEAGRAGGAWRSAVQEPGLLEEASDLVVVEPVDELGAHPRGARDLDRVAVAESG